MELYKSKFSTISLSADQLIIEHRWTAETEVMQPDEFVNEQKNLLRILEEHKKQLIITNASKSKFAITPDLQEWNAKNILNYFSTIGGKKIAIVVPTELLEMLSIEQAMEESSTVGAKFETQYFDSEAAASLWLLKK